MPHAKLTTEQIRRIGDTANTAAAAAAAADGAIALAIVLMWQRITFPFKDRPLVVRVAGSLGNDSPQHWFVHVTVRPPSLSLSFRGLSQLERRRRLHETAGGGARVSLSPTCGQPVCYRSLLVAAPQPLPSLQLLRE